MRAGAHGRTDPRRAILAAMPDTPAKPYRLLGPDRRPYDSPVPGTLGGHRRSRIYGRLDCSSALRALAAGGYRRHRVFFADEPAARAAGFRPCARCLPERYAAWKPAGSAGMSA